MKTQTNATDASNMTIREALAAKQALDALCGSRPPVFAAVEALGPVPSPYDAFLGKAIGIRTVTFSQVGRLVEVHPDELVLEEAACIMDWGRFAGGAAGSVNEVEPYPPGRVIVGRGTIIDCFPFGGKLPLTQK